MPITCSKRGENCAYKVLQLVLDLLLIGWKTGLKYVSNDRYNFFSQNLGLASKLKRKDSLAVKLRTRPTQSELEARNILPS